MAGLETLYLERNKYMIKFIEPFVNKITESDTTRDAWIISRPHLDHSNLDMKSIIKMDLPVSGFRSYVFHIRSSILFRDLLFTLRPIIPWAKSNRTTPLNDDNMFISGEFENTVKVPEIINDLQEVFDDLKKGIPQDYAKKKLPMACSTEFCISIDDRTLITWLKTLKESLPDVYQVYGRLFLDAIGEDDSYISDRYTNSIFDKLSITDYDKELEVGEAKRIADIFVGRYRVTCNLMAQFIRQHYSTIKNGLYNKVANGNYLNQNIRCNDEVDVVIYAQYESFKKVIGVRSCWFAQMDKEDNSSWSSIIGPIVEKMTDKEFLSTLPCKCNHLNCKIKGDMLPRVQMKEVNLPCPILLQKRDLIDSRFTKYDSNSRVMIKWKEIKDNIPEDTENELRLEYENNIRKGLTHEKYS